MFRLNPSDKLAKAIERKNGASRLCTQAAQAADIFCYQAHKAPIRLFISLHSACHTLAARFFSSFIRNMLAG